MKLSNIKLRLLFEWRFIFPLLAFGVLISGCQTNIQKKPNILFCITDDVSFIHTSLQGTAELSTPNFDGVANSGILFNNA